MDEAASPPIRYKRRPSRRIILGHVTPSAGERGKRKLSPWLLLIASERFEEESLPSFRPYLETCRQRRV